MGVHGTNLTNMLFMSPGSQIIELLNGQIINPCYFQLASNLEMSYQALLCSPGPGAVNNHDIKVDVTALAKVLENLEKYNSISEDTY